MFSMAVGDASPSVCKQNNFGTAQIMYTANMNKLLISKDTILHFYDEKTIVFVLIWEYQPGQPVTQKKSAASSMAANPNLA